ncbi:MAG: NfeD family protein [Dehalococcoidales bacterium]|jgi:membrane-bound serine protease (ClpP class)|nr:NfeD family protein [Dehalococcoidales bacterium]
MKRTFKDWLIILVLLLDELAAVVLVLAILWFLQIRVPLWVAIFGALVLGAFAFVAHKVVVPSFHMKKVTGPEGMIGLEGEVVEPLTPTGVVRVTGEYWQAKSMAGDISVGEDVEVLGLNKLVLTVRRKVCSQEGKKTDGRNCGA